MSMEDPTVTTEQEMDEVGDAELVIDAEALDTGSELDAMLDDTQQVEADVTNFTAPVSDIEHGHGLDKGEGEGLHDVRSRWNVRDEFVEDNFVSMPNDHLAIHEMVMRRSEFENADAQVFEDAPNNSAEKWESVESFARSGRAPVPDHARRKLKRIVG